MNDLPSFADPKLLEAGEPTVELGPDATPLQFLQAVYCNENVPLSARLKAATEAAQYVHPRLAVTGVIESQGLGALLDARLKRLAEKKLLPPEVIAEPIK